MSCSSYVVVCSYVVLIPCGTLSMLLMIFVAICCFSSCVRMFFSGSVLVCLCSCSQRYCSADICVGLICCLFCATNLPILVICMMYDTVMVVMITFAFYCTMDPQSPIFVLNHYSRPFGERHEFFGSVCHFLLAFLLLLYDVHHHYLYQSAVC